MASPGENVSFAVKMGTILIPEPGLDHFESLEDKDEAESDESRAQG
jgi:hypothetical protein